MNAKFQLIDKLKNNKRIRESYIRSKVSTNIASQIRALRRREELTQKEMADLTEMKQSRISAMERPDSRLNIETLVRIAAALKMGLTVRFSSFTDMIGWENGFSQDDFDVLRLDEDAAFLSDTSSRTDDEKQFTVGTTVPKINYLSLLARNYSRVRIAAPVIESQNDLSVENLDATSADVWTEDTAPIEMLVVAAEQNASYEVMT
jgi:transcriptional regulator with XRE-family HTH domain